MPFLKLILGQSSRKAILLFSFTLLLLLLLCILNPAKAQQPFKFNRISLPEGYYYGVINGITQDTRGYMWFAGFAALHRYDGYEFITYRHNPEDSTSLAINELEEVYADRKGFIWVGTHAGLDRLDPVTGIFTHFRNQADNAASLSHNHVTSILETRDGTLWVGTMNGLNRLDQTTGTFTRYLHTQNDSTTISNNQVQVLFEDRQQHLWVGTGGVGDKWKDIQDQRNGGLNLFDRNTNKFTRYLHKPDDPRSLADNRIGAIFEDSKGNFWVSTAKDVLHTMDRQKGLFERHPYDPVNPQNLCAPPRSKRANLDLNLFFIKEDGTGHIWYGLSGGWISCFDPATKKTTHFNSFNNEKQVMHTVSGGYTSREGVLWITTYIGNVYRVDPFQLIIPHYNTGSSAIAIHEDVSGDLWIGSFGEGLIKTDRDIKKIKRYADAPASPHNMGDAYVNTIYEENDNTLWFGSDQGLTHYNRNTRIFTRYIHSPQNEILNNDIAAIAGEKTGSFWIGTNDGLALFDTKVGIIKHYRHTANDSNSLGDNGVTSLVKDNAGNLWVGTWQGSLNKFDPRTGKFKRFDCAGHIGDILQDYQNVIWVGTTNGLYRGSSTANTFSRFVDPGMIMKATTVVAGIREDNEKNLWISSSAGIFRISRDRNEISNYSKNQGVDPSDLLYTSMDVSRGRDGKLFFGDRSGFYAFFPDQYRRNNLPPQIVINNFRLADQAEKASGDNPSGLTIKQGKEITLSHDQNAFSFDFAAIHYSSPEDNQLLYMLENLDNSWRKAGNEKTAYYYNVPPGKYVFKIKALSSTGIWAFKAIQVSITPPWWKLWWVRITLFVFTIMVLTGIVRWRVRKKFILQLEHSENEKQLAELNQKTAELQQQATELEMQALRAQMNPHFIFNSLNSINKFILQNNKEMASAYLTKFSRLVRLILQNSQAALIPLESELESLELYLELEAVRFDHQFDYKINIENDLDISVIKVPPLIIQPYAENAIWHGLMHKEEKGHLEIDLFQKDETLCCKITDDGIGRKKAAEFKSKSAATHKSMGMRITADRIAILQKNKQPGSHIQITDLILPDGTAGGTEVILKIPGMYD